MLILEAAIKSTCRLSLADVSLDAFQGVCDWRLDTNVKAYGSYQLGEAPPEPQDQELTQVDEQSAESQLSRLHAFAAASVNSH